MPAMTPTTPHKPSRQRPEGTKSLSSFSQSSHFERPISVATEFVETDIEDDSSVFEEDSEHSAHSSYDSMDSRRQSQTTVSSYGVPTPRSNRERPFEIMIKPVEGPRGPHLFRASQCSADFMFESALQMSPIQPKAVDMPIQMDNAYSSQRTSKVALPPLKTTQSPSPLRDSHRQPKPHDPSHWTIQQVTEYMGQSEVAHDVISKLELHDINGAVLMHLQFDELKELEIPSYGKRVQLWSAIQALKGIGKGPSPAPTPFQDTTRPCPSSRSKSDGDIPYSPCSDSPDSPSTTPMSLSGHKKRRHHKKHRRHRDDPIEPGESVSIVAIEQVIPKPHECSKGEACSKWQKRERLLEAIRKEQAMCGSDWPVSPNNRAGQILITGNPGNPSTAENMLAYTQREQPELRPVSEAVPSVVASSDLLGPGQLPEFALHEETLQQLDHRDPQENVKNFLTFQHVSTGHVEEPPTPPLEMFPSMHHEAFNSRPQVGQSIERPGTVPAVCQNPSYTSVAHEGLRSLPKLSIPRSASANPYLGGDSCRIMSPSDMTPSSCRTATASPSKSFRSPSAPNVLPFGYANNFRAGSEVDVPQMMKRPPLGPVSRDNSQSVPPDMQYREPVVLQQQQQSQQRSASRAEWRRPSFPMPKLDEEDQVSSTITTVPPTVFSTGKGGKQQYQQNRLGTGAGIDKSKNSTTATTHAGWMKKRKTKLLRHEWQDAHFRLHGTILDMHANERLSAALMETIDVDNYSVTVSSLASNSKLSSALKSLKLGGSNSASASGNSGGHNGGNDGDHHTGGAGAGGSSSSSSNNNNNSAAFAFQLVPGNDFRGSGRSGRYASSHGNNKLMKSGAAASSSSSMGTMGKTHYFAVKSSDERIDWMRELMLAKAKKQKENDGFVVELNGGGRF